MIERTIADSSPAAIDAEMNRRFFEMMLRDSADAAAGKPPATIDALHTSFEERVGMSPLDVLREAQRRAAAKDAKKSSSRFELVFPTIGDEKPAAQGADPVDDLAARSTRLLEGHLKAVSAPVLDAGGYHHVKVVIEPQAGASARAVLAVPEEPEDTSGPLLVAFANQVIRNFTRVPSGTRAAFGVDVTAEIRVGPEMVLVAANDDQLACLVGHELAHIHLGHPKTSAWIGEGQRVVGLVGESAVDAVPLAGPLLNAFVPTQDLVGDAFVGMPLRLVGRERAQEFEADRVGQEFAARAGFDPGACADLVLETARHAAAAGQSEDTVPAYWSSHPPSAERILALREEALQVAAPRGNSLEQSAGSE